MLGAKLYKDKLDKEDYTSTSYWCMSNNATIVDKGDYYEVVSIPKANAEELLATAKANAEATVRAMLSATDYKCLKYVDGEMTDEEYAETKAERQRLRELFNAVEACETLEDVQTITDGI